MLATFERIRSINDKYNLSTEVIDQQSKAFATQKVPIPIIGKFSVGKTALINTMLGYGNKLLRENILPETAVPTELYFTTEHEEVIVTKPASTTSISLEKYRESVFDLTDVKWISLKLTNNFLASIKTVMLVDMPGFESGYEVHNRVIDEYLPESLAYLIAFSADDMSLTCNMVNILKELALNDMPVCIVITKADKVTPEILHANQTKLTADLAKHLGKTGLRCCVTSSRQGEVAELRQFLEEIQAESQSIINKKYKAIAYNMAHDTEAYLNTLIQNAGISLSEVHEKEEKLHKEMQELEKRISTQADAFHRIVPECVRDIKADLSRALHNEETSVAVMLLNEQDISEKINVLARMTITQSLKERFIPKVQKHIESITGQINALVSADIGCMGGTVHVDTGSIVKKVVGASVAAIGVIALGPILTLIGSVVAWVLRSRNNDQQRQAQKAQILQKLRSEVFPNVIQQISTQLECELIRHAEDINALLTEEMKHQYDTLSSALAAVVKQRENEAADKERFLLKAQSDLEEVRGIQHECQ